MFQGLDLFHWEPDIASLVKLARDIQYRAVYTVNWLVQRDADDNHEL